MNTKTILAALMMIATTSLASAQSIPPNLLHYQGRLTGSGGTPVTSPQTMYFSIWVGGSASTASSGTQKFLEHVTITPDVNGVFEHLVGSGTKDSGAISPADFNTSVSLYLQVAVGSQTSVLLPRTRFTSVGYAFVANNAVGDITPTSVSIKGYGPVINSSGQWVGQAIGGSGGPTVTTITDTTGGDTISGDVVSLNGSGLSNATVFVGGKQARVKSNTASQVQFAVPAGLPIGINPVAVQIGTNKTLYNVGSINLIRYLMLVSLQDDRIFFINTTTLTVTGVITGLNLADPATDNNAVRHIQVDFANDGALLLVPNNSNGTVFAIDMTKSPIGTSSLVQTFQVTSLQRTAAVAVRPTLTLLPVEQQNSLGGNAAVADPIGNMIRIINITQSFPPFSNGVLANITNNTALHPQVPTGQGISSPRSLRYISDRILYVGFNSGQIQAYQSRFNPDLTRYEWYNDNVVTGFSTYVSTALNNYQMDLTPDHDRILALTGGTQNLQAFWTGNWFTSDSPGGSNTTGSNVFFFSMANNGRIVSASPNEDLLRILKLTDESSILLTGIYHRPTPRNTVTNEAFRRAAIEPVEGNLVVGYVNDLDTQQSRESLILYRVNGGALDRVDQGDPVYDSAGTKLDIDGRFQLWSNSTAANFVDTLGAMQFLP
ncbi:hypothetical protein LLG95_15570 [bacterium]|nr:hypothetical protein [bacterium]